MAAYAALVSLYNIMEQIRTHPRHSFSFDNNQMQSLRENVDFLLDFMENYSHGISEEEADALESQIREATHAAEDVVETHVVDQIHDGSSLNRESIASPCFQKDLQQAIEEMDSVKEMAMKFKAQRGSKNQLPTYSRPAAAISSTGKNAMVGNDEVIRLMEKLTEPHQDRRIIPIVGMGGIALPTWRGELARHGLETWSTNCSDLVCWNAERSHFPVLEGLFLYGVSRLREIPSGIGEIPTLAIIRLRRCAASVAFSALKIVVEQEEVGNEDLQLQVSLDKEENGKFEKMMQLEGLTSNNLRLF